MNATKALCLNFVGLWIAVGSWASDDWPQWRGPRRDDISLERGLLSDWPPEGPAQAWKNDRCGLGYSGFSVVGDQLFTMGQEEGGQFVLCLNANDGSELWRTPVGGEYPNNWGDGPRCTPTVAGDKVVALSADGILICVGAQDGKKIWSVSLKDFGGDVPGWGFCESVLVDGSRVVCTPGGSQGSILALELDTGKKIWQSTEFTEGAQYASIVPATINGAKQYVQLTATNVVGINPDTGGVIWKADWPGKVAVIPTPIVHEDCVYVSSGYGAGSGRFDIDGSNAKSAWANKVMKNHHGGVIRVGDNLYGYSDDAGWVCQDWKTGERVWSEKSKLGKGAVAFADGKLYCVSESGGEVVLIDASPDGWKEHGRFKLSPQTERRKSSGGIWVHPVIANGKMFLRDQEIILAYDIAQP